MGKRAPHAISSDQTRETAPRNAQNGAPNQTLDQTLEKTLDDSFDATTNPPPKASLADFNGRRVLSFESRHAASARRLIEKFGGAPTVVPALREIALRDASVPLFARELGENRVDVAIFTTGIGVRLLARHIEESVARSKWLADLRHVQVVARGSQTLAALRELEISPTLAAPAPYTWRALLTALDARGDIPLAGRRVAIQEYGTPNRAFNRALKARGAHLSRLIVYQWALPLETAPLLRAINGLIEGDFDVVLWTNGAQVWHVFRLAYQHGVESELREALRRMSVVSIGPSCTEALEEWEIEPHFQSVRSRLSETIQDAALFLQTQSQPHANTE